MFTFKRISPAPLNVKTIFESNSSLITVKTIFESDSSRLNNFNDSITKRCGEIILCMVYLEPGWELNNYLRKFYLRLIVICAR